MGTVTLTRTSEYANRLRNYEVYIDGKKVGTISNGETKEFNVSAGQHSIVTKIDWCSSRTLTLQIGENEIAHFEVGGFKNAKWIMPAALIIIILSYVQNFVYGADSVFYFAIPLSLILIYYLTVGRKRYLTLSKTNLER